jgi:hypothetical protein
MVLAIYDCEQEPDGKKLLDLVQKQAYNDIIQILFILTLIRSRLRGWVPCFCDRKSRQRHLTEPMWRGYGGRTS